MAIVATIIARITSALISAYLNEFNILFREKENYLMFDRKILIT